MNLVGGGFGIDYLSTTGDKLSVRSNNVPELLAEAQITNYDSLGRPNGGTILVDCTSLALVDNARGESALLRGENQNCGVEQKDCHEGDSSTAPVAQNEKSLNSAIAIQTQGQVEQSNSTSLLVENSVSGVEVKANHEGESSAALVTEKWSHEAIVARANARPRRMQKLKVAANSGQNPGFDFLQECWNDDPALQIVIKKLLAKYLQWGIACVDGVLVNTGSSSAIADFEGSTPNEDWR
ncbi:MAG: hypothetical protein RM347_034195 [Nostoc sp. ChiQUE02]|uniref:hypothetical protein n=1 Tax=Nostoc sp. ChiQUE02 TaxID=3075377 RepID=UPI002AD423E2|nr:hypothetical protein [Nostoc sp. ChiQUE02]MDZ8232735.1 hypothetical protein [Nostoc sp. ChiQUE02]